MNSFSGKTLILCCCCIFLSGIFYYPKWKQPATEATLSWDVSGYYMYLPAFFIYEDSKRLSFRDSILHKYKPTPDFQQAFLHSSGNYVFKYPAGQAILFAPFFLAGHCIATVSGNYPPDGFSFPYQLCIGIGMLLYACLGLYVLRKLLLLYFDDRVVGITLLTILFATNFFNYSVIDGAMPHNSLFLLYAVLLLLTTKFYANPTIRSAVLIGLVAGLATITRPTEIICLFIPVLWNIGNMAAIKSRFHFFRKHLLYLVTAAVMFLLVVFIQLLYWKSVSGEWIVYSYGKEGFDWFHPHLREGISSYRGGWLIYTPVMVLSLLGFVSLYKMHRQVFFVTVVFVSAFVYLCFSWHEWWYGAGLGQRAMIQSYPILCFPLAAFFSAINKHKIIRIVVTVFVIACVYYNIWLTHQAHRGGFFKGGEMNRTYLFAIAGKYQLQPDLQLLLDNEERYDGDTAKKIADEILTNDTIQADTQNPYSKEYPVTIPSSAKWLRVSADITTPQKEWDTWKMPQFIARFSKNKQVVKTNFIRVSRAMSDGETRRLSLDAKIPKESFDSCVVFFWNGGSEKKVIANKLQAQLF